jgi:hypothetical protein
LHIGFLYAYTTTEYGTLWLTIHNDDTLW